MVPLKIIDLIMREDFDYISIRQYIPELDDYVFAGVCKSENGKLISLDGDSYNDKMTVKDFDRWINEKENIKNGITVYVEEF